MKDVLNPYKGRLQYKTMKASKLYLKYNVHLFKIRLSHEMIIKWNFEEYILMYKYCDLCCSRICNLNCHKAGKHRRETKYIPVNTV